MHQPDDEGTQQVIREVHHYRDANGRTMAFGRLIDTLMPMAIAALVGVVWMLSTTVTRLTEQVATQSLLTNSQFLELKAQMAELKAEGKAQLAELKADVKARQ